MNKLTQRKRRQARIRAKASGTAERPRLAVYRSNTALHIQLINDEEGKTISGIRSDKSKGKTSMEKAKNAGIEIASLAKKAGIKTVVFDRGGFMYSGRIKAVAEGAREGGLSF